MAQLTREISAAEFTEWIALHNVEAAELEAEQKKNKPKKATPRRRKR